MVAGGRSTKGRTPVVDMHAHLGKHDIPWMTQEDAGVFVRDSRRAGITTSVVSAMGALQARSHRAQQRHNELMLRHAEGHAAILVWWVVDPRDGRSLAAGRKLAEHPAVVGLKVHPRLHKYTFSQLADEIFGLAREVRLPVMSHAGHRGCTPQELARAAERYPDARLIIAHFGNCAGGLGHVKALRGRGEGRTFTDTSSSASIQRGIIEMGVRELGAERFLFGTDHNCYHPSAQYYRIAHADLDESARERIFWRNAAAFILKKEQVARVRRLF